MLYHPIRSLYVMLCLCPMITIAGSSARVGRKIKAVISEIYDKELGKGVRSLWVNGKLRRGDTAVGLMKGAVKEGVVSFSRHPLPCVRRLLRQKGYHLEEADKHAIMLHAIEHKASVRVLRYLCKKKIYDPRWMKKGKRFRVMSRLSFMRIFQEIQNRRLFPELPEGRLKTVLGHLYTVIVYVRTLFILYRSLQMLARGLMSNAFSEFLVGRVKVFETGYTVPDIGLRLLDFSFSLQFIFVQFLVKAVIVVCNGWFVEATKPTYLILLLLSDRPKEEKEVIVSYFLAQGADARVGCLFVMPLDIKTDSYKAAMFVGTYQPTSFQYISPIHIATQIGSLPLVKAFQKRGARLGERAVTLIDKVDLQATPPTIDMVTLDDVSEKKSKGKTTYHGLLAFVNASTDRALKAYLVKAGLKKKKKKRVKKASHADLVHGQSL